jgi:two-component system cell cycle sensor histidine kinase/response regulator CckA
MADATQIRQVVMNLITNASEAIGDRSGVISITTEAMECDREYLKEMFLDEDLPEGVYVSLTVADTGRGMDANTLNRLFDPFFTTKFTGRGLGLAAVLGIVRGHKGAVKVYSEVGHGATFRVLLPAIDEPATHRKEPAVPTSHWEPHGAILLADDEETVRTVAKRMLERIGFSVITADDGDEAVRLYQQHRPDIAAVILDLTMPRMDGEEAFRQLRRIDPNVRVLMSSGYNQQDVTQRFVGKGLAGFIQKPYHLNTLVERMRQILADGDLQT